MRMLETDLIIPRSAETGNIPFEAPGARLVLLMAEHDDLDCAIAALLAGGTHDDLLIRRLKKRKLHLKDEIAQIMPRPQIRSIAG